MIFHLVGDCSTAAAEGPAVGPLARNYKGSEVSFSRKQIVFQAGDTSSHGGVGLGIGDL